jgi:hypothetical protein
MNQCLVFFYHYYPTGSNMNNQVQTENKYFQSRMQLLGITAENNKIGIKHTSATEVEIDANGVGTHKITIIDVPIFRPHERALKSWCIILKGISFPTHLKMPGTKNGGQLFGWNIRSKR